MEEQKISYKHSIIFSILVSAIGSFLLVGDFKQEASFGWFIFFLIALCGNLLVLKKSFKEFFIGNFDLAIIISYIILCFGFIINTKEHTINGFLLLMLFTFIEVNLLIKNINNNFISKYFKVLGMYITNKFKGLFGYFREASVESKNLKVYKTELGKFRTDEIISTVSLFIFLGIPLILIVLGMLSSSSETFSNWISNIFNFDLEFGVAVERFFFIFFWFLFFTTEFYFVHKLLKNKEKVEKSEFNAFDDMNKNLGLTFIMTIIVLNLFYILFVIAQLKYDFGDLKEYISNNNLSSFSELAVGRFNELIKVSLINIMIVYLGRRTLNILKEKSVVLKSIIDVNIAIFFVNTVLLIISVFKRLDLYLGSYGYTFRRFGALTFLPVLLAITIMIFATLYYKQYNKIYLASITTLIVYFALVISLPTTYIVNKLNFDLAKNGDIEVSDPTYTVRSDKSFVFELYVPNDVRDDDGLLVGIDYLESKDHDLTSNEEELIENRLKDFNNETDSNDIREFNLMKMLIRNKMED